MDYVSYYVSMKNYDELFLQGVYDINKDSDISIKDS